MLVHVCMRVSVCDWCVLVFACVLVVFVCECRLVRVFFVCVRILGRVCVFAYAPTCTHACV